MLWNRVVLIKSAYAHQNTQIHSVIRERGITQYTNHTWLQLLILLIVDGSWKEPCNLQSRVQLYQAQPQNLSLAVWHINAVGLISSLRPGISVLRLILHHSTNNSCTPRAGEHTHTLYSSSLIHEHAVYAMC